VRVHQSAGIRSAVGAETSASPTKALDRRAGLSKAEFVAEYLNPGRPVILTDAAHAWPLYKHCTPGYFRSRYGQHEIHVRGIEYRLADLLDLLEASTEEDPSPYPCKLSIPHEFRDLLNEISPRFEYSLPDRQANPLVPQRLFQNVNNLEIFFGGRGGQFPYLHYDVLRLHAWITQLHGEKEFTLFEPGQEDLLYVNPSTPWQSSIKNHHSPDYTRYPLFREARRQTVVIRAGETLFLPCGWWHTARSLNLTISIAFDQLGPDNWPAFIGDVVGGGRQRKHFRTLVLGAYLQSIGRLLNVAERFGVNQSTTWGKR
jgi:histone arginine demethylase JMJD6